MTRKEWIDTVAAALRDGTYTELRAAGVVCECSPGVINESLRVEHDGATWWCAVCPACRRVWAVAE